MIMVFELTRIWFEYHCIYLALKLMSLYHEIHSHFHRWNNAVRNIFCSIRYMFYSIEWEGVCHKELRIEFEIVLSKICTRQLRYKRSNRLHLIQSSKKYC